MVYSALDGQTIQVEDFRSFVRLTVDDADGRAIATVDMSRDNATDLISELEAATADGRLPAFPARFFRGRS